MTHSHHSHTAGEHGHRHHHGGHSHGNRHGRGHNQPDVEHLHSHAHGTNRKEREQELQSLGAAFIEGYRSAEDKNSYLRIAGVPFSRTGADGLAMHLVDVSITSNWQVGTASPAFASRELVYMPFPGKMISGRETMLFTYVSLTAREDVDLRQFLHVKHQHDEDHHHHHHHERG